MGKRKLSVAIREYNKKMKNLSNAEERKMKEVKRLALILLEKHKVSHYSFSFGYGWRYLGRCTSTAIILNYKHALFGDMEDIKI